MATDVSVRLARGSDAAAVADLQLACWAEAYTGVHPADTLEATTAERASMASRWEESALAPPSPRHHVLVAVAGSDLAGAAATGPADDEGLDPATDGELMVLLVAPARRRAGHGSRLLAACVDHLRGDGFVRAVCWLDEADTAGAQLLGSSGWARDGAVRVLDLDGDGAVLVRQARWHTDLGEQPNDGDHSSESSSQKEGAR